jgi:hypothetical protein
MSKHEEADLILKLYELRREATLREARDWYSLEFHPESMADVHAALYGEHSGHFRMVMTYWEMAAALVNHGAISMELFNATNGEHIGVFSKMEPLLEQARAAMGPHLLVSLEKLIDATSNGRARSAATRERMKAVRAELANRKAETVVTD